MGRRQKEKIDPFHVVHWGRYAHVVKCAGCDAHYLGRQSDGGHCPICHRTFANDSSALAHRIGPHEPRGLRRCLTRGELEERGWRHTDKGWTKFQPMPSGTFAGSPPA